MLVDLREVRKALEDNNISEAKIEDVMFELGKIVVSDSQMETMAQKRRKKKIKALTEQLAKTKDWKEKAVINSKIISLGLEEDEVIE